MWGQTVFVANKLQDIFTQILWVSLLWLWFTPPLMALQKEGKVYDESYFIFSFLLYSGTSWNTMEHHGTIPPDTLTI